MPTDLPATTRRAVPVWWAFIPFVLVSAVHVGILFAGGGPFAQPSKLLLMPTLALALMWGLRGTGISTGTRAVLPLMLAGLFFSWLGDGAGTFFPFAPTLPLMLLFFGVAHLCYMRLFWRHLALRTLPWWALVFAAWWVALLVFLWPRAGSLAIAVAIYGIVLGGTATLSARCNPVVFCGGVFFLASDTILAFRLFAPELLPGWSSGLVMLTYTLGQGLIVAGALATHKGSARGWLVGGMSGRRG